ncbi:hypothetical protein [Actinomadura madurae]|uniref:hypothetical protein n=1 Tax=Actinomadura madurae TaxID=1993 RepID=UPI0020D21B32|nr:hypothetical protein [Actinomadura madurae]MCP9978593.1 hypothetical protein [Actinomadura madurae]MCQ0014793.1 hypothetical protein [Actinomadura madurae]
MTAPLQLLAGRGGDLLVRIAGVACSGRDLPGMAERLAELVVRSAGALTFCDVYVLDDDERVLEWPGPPVPLGEGTSAGPPRTAGSAPIRTGAAPRSPCTTRAR